MSPSPEGPKPLQPSTDSDLFRNASDSIVNSESAADNVQSPLRIMACCTPIADQKLAPAALDDRVRITAANSTTPPSSNNSTPAPPQPGWDEGVTPRLQSSTAGPAMASSQPTLASARALRNSLRARAHSTLSEVHSAATLSAPYRSSAISRIHLPVRCPSSAMTISRSLLAVGVPDVNAPSPLNRVRSRARTRGCATSGPRSPVRRPRRPLKDAGCRLLSPSMQCIRSLGNSHPSVILSVIRRTVDCYSILATGM